MNSRTHIDISLEYNGNQIDLRIPIQVTMLRLCELLDKALKSDGIFLPEGWRMELKNKPINIEDYDYLEDFPVGNGDIFEVITPEEEKRRWNSMIGK